ncbi:MAG: hypothetical protein ACQXXJ_05620 [Candidatus Bathyarchaeia archaeon]|jgi:hypothetical protein
MDFRVELIRGVADEVAMELLWKSMRKLPEKLIYPLHGSLLDEKLDKQTL